MRLCTSMKFEYVWLLLKIHLQVLIIHSGFVHIFLWFFPLTKFTSLWKCILDWSFVSCYILSFKNITIWNTNCKQMILQLLTFYVYINEILVRVPKYDYCWKYIYEYVYHWTKYTSLWKLNLYYRGFRLWLHIIIAKHYYLEHKLQPLIFYARMMIPRQNSIFLNNI